MHSAILGISGNTEMRVLATYKIPMLSMILVILFNDSSAVTANFAILFDTSLIDSAMETEASPTLVAVSLNSSGKLTSCGSEP